MKNLQQTSQFHLNQWELTDRIRMEDFNGDNQKLETALASLAAADAAEQQARTAQDAAIRREAAAAAEAVPLVKLLEVPVTQEAAQVDVDVSQIDFTQYTEVWIVPILSTAYHYIYLRCNNIATDSYFHPGTHQNYLCRLEANGRLGQSKNPSGGLSLPRCLHLREYLRYIEPALLQHHPLHRAEGPEDAEFCGGRRNHQRGRENHPLGLETVTQRNAPGQKSGGPSTLPVLAAKERLIHQFVSSASWAKACANPRKPCVRAGRSYQRVCRPALTMPDT